MKIGDKIRVKNPLWDTKLSRVSEYSGKQGFIKDVVSNGDVVVQLVDSCRVVFNQNEVNVIWELNEY
jgi:hypothetical protein